MSPEALLEVRELVVRYRRRRGQTFDAVHDVTFDVQEQETVSLVGESGAGKSTVGRAILGLTPVASGSVRFAGEDITRAPRARRRELSRQLQTVFQDPFGSLSPGRTVGQTLAEPLSVHEELTESEIANRVA